MNRDAQPATAPGRRRRPPSALGDRLGRRAAAGDGRARPGPRRRPVEVENLRIGFGSTNSFKIGTWTPVWVQLRGGDERFERVHGRGRRRRRRDADVVPACRWTWPPRPSQRFTAYVRPGSRDPELTIRLLDRERPAGGRASQDAVHAAASRVDHARTRR